LAAFWAAALGRDLNPGATQESASLAAANGDQPILARLLSLGATELATFPAWTTLADPEGNEFDLIRAITRDNKASEENR
jgi:hypothetical protein